MGALVQGLRVFGGLAVRWGVENKEKTRGLAQGCRSEVSCLEKERRPRVWSSKSRQRGLDAGLPRGRGEPGGPHGCGQRHSLSKGSDAPYMTEGSVSCI